MDGVGLGPATSDNPFMAARLPTLDALLGGRRPTLQAAPYHGADASLVGVDATLGVPGLPQSGTGQATLLTGDDAVRRFGRHQGPWVPTALRPLVAGRSVLALAKAAGRRVAFANAYPEELVRRALRPEREVGHGMEAPGALAGQGGSRDRADQVERPMDRLLSSRRLGPLRAGPPLAAIGAGALTRHTAELAAGDAVASEITNGGWIRHLGRSLPEPTPAEAGAVLARIVGRTDLTLFAHYSTDLVGHRGTMQEAVAALERVDAFLGGVLDALSADATVLVVSDHGNIEDTGRAHTRNPALGLVVGRGHGELAASLGDLRDVAGAALRAAGV